ncbi:MAG: ABC transporter ATP-binding protein [Elsteraceae bacterium]
MNELLVKVEGLSVRLPAGADRDHAISDIDMELNAGEILCVVGESGSGKSMTASAIMGLLPPGLPVETGRIRFEGRDLVGLSESEWRSLRGRRMGMIFQEPMTALNPIMTVERQIAEVLEAHPGVWPGPVDARVLELLSAVGLPDPELIRKSHPFRLSGGQRQRVMIATALALEPRVLIADEPTTALDVTTQMQILGLIKQIQSAKGMGVLFITHDFGVVAEIADRVAVMQHGRIVETGPAAQILNEPQHPYTRSLIAAVPRLEAKAARANDGPVVFEATGVRKTFHRSGSWFGRGKAVPAVADADFKLALGETLGLVGESGSGKSTLARCAVRLLQPEEGKILLHGVDLRPLSSSAMKPYRKKMQMVFQDPFASLNPRRTIGQIISEGPVTHGESESVAMTRARDLLRLVGLDAGAIDRYPHEFSGGQRQRVGIARALAMEPEILIADEPVSALDVSVQAQVLDLLAEIRQRLGLTMLFITHDLRVAAQICDRVAVMQRGRIVEIGPTAQIFTDPQHPYTRDLLNAIPGKDWRPPLLAA